MVRSQAEALGLKLSSAECERLVALRDVILKYNRRINLIAQCTPAQAVERHLIDSLALRRILDRRSGIATEASPSTIYDIGSGGGFPGLVLALAYPDATLHLVEPIGKKAVLIGQAARHIGLANVIVHNCRLDELAPVTGGPCWAVSRATFHPLEWVTVGRSFVQPGGAIIVMLGGAEASDVLADAVHVDRFVLPDTGSTRVNAVLLG